MLRILISAAIALFLLGSAAQAADTTPAPARNSSSIEKAQDGSFLVAQYYGHGRVCCKRGWRDWWTYSYRSCRRAGGHVVRNRHCRNDGYEGIGFRRICCKRGYRDWWSTPRHCLRSGGYIVSNRHCRWD